MSSLAPTLTELIRYLLPGFLAAWIYYGFTPHEKPGQFERVIQAFIFTLFIRPGVLLLQSILLFIGKRFSLGVWDGDSDLIASTFGALILGFTFAFFSNFDHFHRLIRFFKISEETSYPSIWCGEFSKRKTWIVLHLSGSRRLYGWPKEWPSSSKNDHFSMVDAIWLIDEDDKEDIELVTVDAILISTEDVQMVEFLSQSE